MRAMIKSTFPLGGYTVRNENGKVILQKRWKDGRRQNAVLPLAWEQTNALDVVETIRAVNGQMTSGTGTNLKEAVRLLLPVENHEGGVTVNWDAIAKAYPADSINSGRFKQETWDDGIQYVVRRVLEIVTAVGGPTTGVGILKQMTEGDPGSRGREVRIGRAAGFLTYAVTKKGMDKRWLPPEPGSEEMKDLKGRKVVNKKKPTDETAKRGGKAGYLTDEQFIQIYESETDPSWKLAIGLQGVFGLRGVELEYCKKKGSKLHVFYRKKSSKGEPTPERDVTALDPKGHDGMGQKLLMELASGLTPLPPLGSKDNETGEKITKHMRRNPLWNQFEAASIVANDRKLTSYSFRHSFAYRSSILYDLSPRTAHKLMGHSLATHLKDYGSDLYDQDMDEVLAAARKRVLATTA